MHGIGEISDRLALRELVDRYAQAVDRRDQSQLLELFSVDASVTLPPPLARRLSSAELRGPEEISSLLSAVEHVHSTTHVVSQQTVQLHGDIAVGETYCTAHHIYGPDGELRDSTLSIRYQDEYVRSAVGWRFRHRELRVDWVSDQPVTVLT